MAMVAAAKSKPPPPKPKPSHLAGAKQAEMVTALYDFAAQADGDLSFSAGDVIEIVQRTQNENEWWTGKLRGKQGQFPGMCEMQVKSDNKLTIMQETMFSRHEMGIMRVVNRAAVIHTKLGVRRLLCGGVVTANC